MNVITGTQSNDILNGSDGADTIEGLGGNDVVEAGGGDDSVRGGDGYDVLWGGIGGDSIEAGAGGGEIYGEAGNDALIGGAGADSIWDGAGDDSVVGGAGDDVLRSSWYTRNGISVSPSGSDRLDGGDGNDLILIHRENVVSGNFVHAIGGAGADTIEIGSYGGNNSYIVDAGADNDVINFRAERFEAFTVSAGTGNDLVFFELLSGPAAVSLGTGADVVRIGQFVSIRVGLASITIEDFEAGAAGDRLDFDAFVAAALTNWDQAGNPFGSGHLRLVEKGQDTILQIDRDGAGTAYDFVNLVTFQNMAKAALTAFNLDGYDPNGGSAGQTIAGTEGADRLGGGSGADTIEGLGGNDVIEGGGGDDLLRGGGGYDVLWGGIGADRIEAGDGGGEIFGEQGGDTIVGGSGADVVWDGAGDDNVLGGSGNDELRSLWYRRDEVSIAATGSDTLDGGEGNDLILIRRENTVSGETVRAIGGAGHDIIDIISGGANHFIVDAGMGDDSVLIRSEGTATHIASAGDGRDLVFIELAGGPVAITLGGGSDELRIGQQVNLRLGTVAIAVSDFETGALGDRFDFDVFLANTLIGWDGVANPFGTGHLELVQSGADTLLRIDRDGGGNSHAFVTLVTFSNTGAAGFTVDNLDGFAPSGGAVEGRTITGTEAGETLNGTAGSDTIDGLGGNDVVEGGAGDDLIRGGTGYDMLWGGLGVDTIEAGADGGYIYGEAGDDLLTGGGGMDRIYDGAGNDVVLGGAGDDQLRSSHYTRNEFGVSSSGSDRLDAGEGDDIILIHRDSTTAGDVVTAIGGAGRDTIDIGSYGGRNSYHVDTGADEDLVILVSGQNEAFKVDSGTGNDVVQIDYLAGSASLTLGAGADVFRIGQFQRDFLSTASIVVEDFQTGAAGDRLDFDVFVAEALIGWDGAANPFALGYLSLVRSGTDTLLRIDRDALAGGHGAVTLVTFRNTDSSTFAAFNLDGYTPVTRAAGSEAGDALEGTSTGDWIEGLGGDDVINTGSGSDLLDGGTGADTMRGGTENDIYLVDDFGDRVIEDAGEGTDEVRTALVSHVLAAEVENLTATSDVNHDFRGNAGNNLVTGGAGRDILRLYDGGDDTVLGGGGDDNLFFVGSLTSADIVNGGSGTDTLVLQGAYGSLTLTANITQIENVSILGGNNINFGEPGTNRYDYVLTTHDANFAAGVQARINGAALLEGEDFTFDGSAETDASYVVYGGKGKDTLTGGLGNDIFFYAEERFASGDTVNGGAGYDGMFLRGNYTIDFNAPGYTGLFSNIENLTLTSATDERYARGGGTEFDYNLTLSDAIVGAGQLLTVSGALLMATETMVLDGSGETDGRFNLFGGQSADTLKGGALADLIHGNFGADILSGGGAADAFRYQAVTESYSVARDHIIDFTPGTDKIELDRIDANDRVGGDQAFAWIGSNAFSNTAGELRATQQGGQWIVEGDINGDGYADLIIALTLQGPAPLGAGDFLL